MRINHELNSQLSFLQNELSEAASSEYLNIAQLYAKAEHSIAVLSDLRQGVSHIFYGSMGDTLALAPNGTYHRVDTIWEEEILSNIHPEDLESKQLFELQFLYFQQKQQNLCWRMEHLVHIKNNENIYHKLLHRIMYLSESASNSIDYALCLYSFTCDEFRGGRMVNMQTGEVRYLEDQDYSDLISQREKEVLKCIQQGLLSKEIAIRLGISINTVNRHRQNILQKLQSNNSIEACKRATELGMLL